MRSISATLIWFFFVLLQQFQFLLIEQLLLHLFVPDRFSLLGLVDQHFYSMLQVFDLDNFLCPFRVVGAKINWDNSLLPLLADVALSSVTPVIALLYIVTAEDARENNFVHVSCHRVFDE